MSSPFFTKLGTLHSFGVLSTKHYSQFGCVHTCTPTMGQWLHYLMQCAQSYISAISSPFFPKLETLHPFGVLSTKHYSHWGWVHTCMLTKEQCSHYFLQCAQSYISAISSPFFTKHGTLHSFGVLSTKHYSQFGCVHTCTPTKGKCAHYFWQ